MEKQELKEHCPAAVQTFTLIRGRSMGQWLGTGRFNMLRLTVAQEEYLMIGDDVKIVFLGGTGKHMRIMIDAPKEVNIVRSSVIERQFTDPEIRATLPKYYAQKEHPEKYRKKANVVITGGNAEN